MRVSAGIAFVVFMGWALAGAADSYELKSRLLPIASPNDPVLYDVDADGRQEVIASAVGGWVGVYRLPALNLLWEHQIPARAVSAPAVGDLRGNGEGVICLASGEGTVFFLSAGSGELLATLNLGKPATVAPTIVEPTPGAARDGLVVCDEEGALYYIEWGNSEPKITWTAPNRVAGSAAGDQVVLGRINHPASVGDIDGDGSPEIIIGTALGKVVTTNIKEPSRRLVWHGPQGTAIQTNVAAADFFGLGRDALAFGTSVGSLFAVAYDPASNQLKTAVGQLTLSGPAAGQLLAADFDGDGLADLVASSPNAVLSFAPASGFTLRGEPYGANAPPFSAVSLFATAERSWRALFTDGKGLLHLLDPQENALGAYYSLGEVANSTILCGRLTNSEFAEAVFLTRNRTRLTYVALSERKAAAAALPTMAYGGHYGRNGLLSTHTLVRLERQRAKLNQWLEDELSKAKELYAAGRFAECRNELGTLLKRFPYHPEARSLNRRAALRQRWYVYLALLVLAGGGAYAALGASMRVRKFRNLNERIKQLVEIQAYPQALALLRPMRKKDPKNLTVLRWMARVVTLWERTDDEAIEILEAACEALPDEGDFKLALARAYAAQGAETEKALEMYLIAVAVLEEGRGEIAYHAGRICEAKGDLDQALRLYRLAEREGCNARDLTDRLVELYLATRQFSERALGVFEKVFPARTQDERFLEGLCRAQAAARTVDNLARAAASNLLALNPNSVIALRQLAKCELQAGHVDKATDFAERAHALDPSDDQTVLVLAYCYSAADRTDEKAGHIYNQALQVDPENPAFLRGAALTSTPRAGTIDESAFNLLKRALQANPSDAQLLKLYATAARQRGEFREALAAYEKLIELGESGASLSCALAELYARLGEGSAKAIPAYEEALKIDPDNATYLLALANAYLKAGRSDLPAVQVIEKALQKTPQAQELGIFLVHHYLSCERYEDALKLARWLLQSDKENEQLQKLVAEASFACNRLDEAIAQYQHLLERQPADEEVIVHLAQAYARKHRTDAVAAQLYERALQISPQQPLVRFMLARHHAMAGRYAEALDQLGEVFRHNPQDHLERLLEETRLYIVHAPERTDLRWFLVTLLTEANAFAEACEQLDQLLATDPGELKAIIQAYDRILAKDPMNVPALMGKGRLLQAQGRLEAARPLLEQAYRITPQNAEVRNTLKELYEAILAETDDTDVRFSLAQVLFAEGAYDKAIVLFQKTAQDFRYENESIKMLGQCFMAKGMLEFAFQEFRKLLIDDEIKELLYSLAQRYEAKSDFVGAKQVYRVLYAADANYRDVKHKFELLAGATSDPMATDRSTLITQLSERAQSRYELIEELGRGAMGIVYRARDNELEEIVALKILPENLSQNPEALHRFRAEARAARRLSHPHIVRIHDIGEEKGRKYISMEFIKGTDLKRLLRQRGKLSVEKALSIILPLCDALEYAHRNGIVHRDIKPANIMITESGAPKLSDFGIAKALEATSETVTGAIIGTPLYMSPEQVQGQPVDQRADIYALGIMFYEVLNGKPPFVEGDIAYQHCRVPARPIEGIPEELNSIILKCLAKKREDRWSSAAELGQALRAWFEKWKREQDKGGDSPANS